MSLIPHTPLTQVVVDRSVTSLVLKNLMSLTEYQISVFAIYAHTASEGLRGTETTRTYFTLHHFSRGPDPVPWWASCLGFSG